VTKVLYPERLISTESIVSQINQQVCGECIMMHRAMKDQELYTIGQEIDPEIINFERFCGLSLNTLLCGHHSHSKNCSKDDVKYSVIGNKKKEFVFTNFESNSQIPNYEEIEFTFNPNIKVIGFKKSDMESITDEYPFKKNGKVETQEYTFKITIIYKPTPLNVLHFEILLEGTHPTEKDKTMNFKMLKGRTSKKEYLDSIISKIKNRIIKNNFLFEVK